MMSPGTQSGQLSLCDLRSVLRLNYINAQGGNRLGCGWPCFLCFPLARLMWRTEFENNIDRRTQVVLMRRDSRCPSAPIPSLT